MVILLKGERHQHLGMVCWGGPENPANFICPIGAVWEGGTLASTFIGKYCLGKIKGEFPSQFMFKTLGEIENLAKCGDQAARKALKLLKDNRFRKPCK